MVRVGLGQMRAGLMKWAWFVVGRAGTMGGASNVGGACGGQGLWWAGLDPVGWG